jgi:hypothetical protein
MQAELVFNIFNTLILPPWLLMVVAPRWWLTQKLVNSYVVPLALAVAYVVIIFSNLQGIASADFGSLKGIQALFVAAGGAPFFAAAAWFHYLAFIGRYLDFERLTKNRHYPLAYYPLFVFYFYARSNRLSVVSYNQMGAYPNDK